jgi:4-hydroxybenzoate polyprenyltransferase
MPEPKVVAELVRLPAVLSVPGDALLGLAASGAAATPVQVVGRVAASGCIYLGGMALNDYADREVDAAERPHRPIPSGRVEPVFALRLAQGLTAGGVAIAGVVGGGRALRVAVPLAATVWAYDLSVKNTAAGPVAMAGCRALDVMLGASAGGLRHGVVPAAIVAGHTLTITLVSRHEAEGGKPEVAKRAMWGTAAVTCAAGAYALRSVLRTGKTGAGSRHRSAGLKGRAPAIAASALSAGLLTAYSSAMTRAANEAVDEPSPAKLQKVVGTGVLGFMPLEGALLAGLRRTVTGAAVATAWPLARHLARRRAVT